MRLQELLSIPVNSKILPAHRDTKLQNSGRENSVVYKEIWLQLLP